MCVCMRVCLYVHKYINKQTHTNVHTQRKTHCLYESSAAAVALPRPLPLSSFFFHSSCLKHRRCEQIPAHRFSQSRPALCRGGPSSF